MTLPSAFQDETWAFVLEGMESLGAVDSLIGTLEGALSDSLGHTGGTVPQDEIDGLVAATLASADAVAIMLGQPRPGERPEIVAALMAEAEELQAEEGVADLAAKALAAVSDPAKPRYAASIGAFADRAQLDAVAADIAARLERARAAFPGEWDLTALETSGIRITWHGDAG